MTSQSPEVRALASCSFAPATFSKRFARDLASMSPDHPLTEKQERCMWRMLYIFRRQVPADIAAEAIRRKVNHQLLSAFTMQCAVCQRVMLSKRERNAPCPGPPEPKTPRKRRTAEQGAVPAVVVGHDAPNLFEEMA